MSKKIKIEIEHWVTGSVLFAYETEDNTLRKTLEKAVSGGADLRGADLRGAYLRGAYLQGADLEKLPVSYVNQASRDMLFIFQSLKSELPFLREKLIKGEVDGSVYEGDCACLVGTLANAENKSVEQVCEYIPFYDKGTHNPAEAWFLNIIEGDTPDNNAFAKHALMLIDMVLKPRKKAVEEIRVITGRMKKRS